MYNELTLQDLKKIVYASVLFGGGGGGSAIEGFALIEEMEKAGFERIELVSRENMQEMEDGKTVVSAMVAALGSPTATKGQTFIDEAQNAVKAMSEAALDDGKILKYIYSGEQGGGNTMLPIFTAWKLNMPLLDLDGNGRAVPEMNTGLQPIYGIPTSPVALGSGVGDTIIAKTKDPCDSLACENIARCLCQAYGQGIGFSAWLMSKAQHEHSALGQISLDVDIGEIIANSTKDTILMSLSGRLHVAKQEMTVLAKGTVQDIKIDAEGGFDTGTTIIAGDNNETFKVLFQNENLVCYRVEEDQSEVVLATVPGIISLIDLEPGDVEHPIPVSNTETEIGQRVALVYIAPPAGWYGIPEGYGCWKEVLISAGYCEVHAEVRP